jgi:hypothetical protein
MGLYDPIVYLSDFWHLRRDLIPVNEESLENLRKVRLGETTGDPETMDEFALKNANWDGLINLSWDNYDLSYFSYQW